MRVQKGRNGHHLTDVDKSSLVVEALGPDFLKANDAVHTLAKDGAASADSLLEIAELTDDPRIRQLAITTARIDSVAFAKWGGFLHRVLRQDEDLSIRCDAAEALMTSDPIATLDETSVFDPVVDILKRRSDDIDVYTAGRCADLLKRREFHGFKLSREVLANLWREQFFYQRDYPTQSAMAGAILAMSDPELRLDALFDAFASEAWLSREHLDGWPLRDAFASEHEQRETAARYVVEYVGKRKEKLYPRMIEMCASILIAVSGSSRVAGDYITKVSSNRASNELLDEEYLRDLRVEVGGVTALQPLIDQLENEFSQPLARLWATAEYDWRSANTAGKVGFYTRMVMSAAIFVLGFVVTIVSAYQIIWQGIPAGELWGPGVSFLAGIGAMLAVTYSGPLKDIRESVLDRANSWVAFTAYAHQLRFITALFASEYARGRLTYKDLRAAEDLLTKASAQSVSTFNALKAIDGRRRMIRKKRSTRTADRAESKQPAGKTSVVAGTEERTELAHGAAGTERAP